MTEGRRAAQLEGAPRAAVPLPDLGFVALGGALGTLARSLLGGAIGEPGAGEVFSGLPLGTLVINVGGAFLLGMLVEALNLAGSDRGSRRTARLLLGTGLLGGFTTYSLLSTELAELVLENRFAIAAVYGTATLVGGAVASWFGILAARALRARTTRARRTQAVRARRRHVRGARR